MMNINRHVRLLLTAVLVSILLIGCSSKQEKRDSFMENGMKYEKSGDLVRARLEYKNALQVDPECVECLMRLGKVEFALKNLRGAYAAFANAADVAPDRIDVLVDLSKILLMGHAGKKAEEVAQKILKKDPENEQGLIIRAIALSIQEGKQQEAMKALEDIRTRYPDRSEGYVVAARHMILQKNFRDAERLLETGLSKVKNKRSIYKELITLYSAEKQWDKAIHYGELLYANSPESASTCVTMAQLYAKKGDMEGAEKKWKKALELSKGATNVLLLRAQFLIMEKQIDRAEQELREALQQHPQNTKLRIALARLLANTKRGDKALELLEAGISEDMKKPARIRLMDEEARINFGLGRFDKAEELTENILKENHRDLAALTVQARLALIRKQGEKAVGILRRLLEEEPGNRQYQMLLAQAYALNHDYKLAENQIRQIIAKNPKDVNAYQALIQLYIIEKDMKQAQKAASDALKKLPESAQLHNIMGMIMWSSQNTDQAEANFRKAIDLAPQWLMPYRNLAALKLNAGDPAEAEDTFKKAAERYPDATGPKILLATLYEQTGKIQKAIDIYEKLLKKYPDSAIIMNNLAFLYADSSSDPKTIEKAFTLIKRAMSKREPTPPTFIDTLAWIYYRSGQIKKAIEVINQVIAKAPDNPTLLYHQAVILKEAGDKKQAIEALDKTMEQSRPFPEKTKAEKLLKELTDQK